MIGLIALICMIPALLVPFIHAMCIKDNDGFIKYGIIWVFLLGIFTIVEPNIVFYQESRFKYEDLVITIQQYMFFSCLISVVVSGLVRFIIL